MPALVSVDTDAKELRRYECGGEIARPTHICVSDEPATAKEIEWFRRWPDSRFAVEPGPRPTNPPAGAGLIRAA